MKSFGEVILRIKVLYLKKRNMSFRNEKKYVDIDTCCAVCISLFLCSSTRKDLEPNLSCLVKKHIIMSPHAFYLVEWTRLLYKPFLSWISSVVPPSGTTSFQLSLSSYTVHLLKTVSSARLWLLMSVYFYIINM